MDSTSVYGPELLALEGTGGKALATDQACLKGQIFLYTVHTKTLFGLHQSGIISKLFCLK